MNFLYLFLQPVSPVRAAARRWLAILSMNFFYLFEPIIAHLANGEKPEKPRRCAFVDFNTSFCSFWAHRRLCLFSAIIYPCSPRKGVIACCLLSFLLSDPFWRVWSHTTSACGWTGSWTFCEHTVTDWARSINVQEPPVFAHTGGFFKFGDNMRLCPISFAIIITRYSKRSKNYPYLTFVILCGVWIANFSYCNRHN